MVTHRRAASRADRVTELISSCYVNFIEVF